MMKSFRLQKEEPCMICLVNFEDPCEIAILGCDPKHFLHKECCDSLVKHFAKKGGSATCPLCRAEIDVSKTKVAAYKGLETPII